MKKRIKRLENKQSHMMLKPKAKVYGMIWEFHKGDNDNHPSVPHGHSIDGKYKLELWTGDIYDIQTGQKKFKAKKKDMKALYNFPGFNDFVKECRDEYKKRNPTITLPTLKYNLYISRQKRHVTSKEGGFTFFIRYDNV